MTTDRKDILGGTLITVIGASLAIYAATHYDMGSLRRMGTGFFPTICGTLFALLGLAIALPPILRGSRPGALGLPPLRASGFVLAAVAAFALLVRPFGLFPAIAALVVLSSLANSERPRLRDLAFMTLALCLLAWLLFGLSFSLGLDMISWPW